MNNFTIGGNMRRWLAVLVLLPVLALAQTKTTPKKTTGKAKATATPEPAVIVTPDKIQWGPAPPVLQPGAQAAVIAGDPSGPGPFIMRLKVPNGYRVMPHWHPTTENITVISGEFGVAMGDKFDESKLQPLPARSVAVVPAHHSHYAMAKGETEVQINGMGPFKLTYVNPADDPSKKK
jgi:anti-sigma factor ChrR (cupin superfamily)